MPSSFAVPEDAPASHPRNRVFVTGAGFTRALVQNAPLLIDDFGNDALADRVRGLPHASRLLEWERNRHRMGHIDVKRLMTRLESLMPYDHAEFADNAVNEYALLLSELKRSFLDRIREAEQGTVRRDEGISGSGLLLLKLHGSVNWRPKLGHASPVPLDAITHHDRWSDTGSAHLPDVGIHLETQPVVVPPVLSKSSLVEQPILRLVWSHAFTVLQSAHEVTFLGYSFPATDIAARTLCSEALKDLPREDIHVVNLASDDSHAENIRTAYRSALGNISEGQFHLDGALSMAIENCSFLATASVLQRDQTTIIGKFFWSPLVARADRGRHV